MSAKRVERLEDNSFDKIDAEVLIDGQQCRWVFLNDKPLTYSTTRIDATHVQEWLFTQPRLHEEVGPSQIKPNKDLGTTVIQLRRARSGGEEGVSYRYTALRGPDTISERTKKGVLGAVTNLRKPEDIINPLWTFRCNYATEAILQAQGRIALKHNIKRGEPGLIATAPIDLDDDEPGPSMRTLKGRKRLEGNKARTGLMAQEAELDAMEDDLSQFSSPRPGRTSKDQGKEAKLFLASAEQSDEEDDTKAAVKRHMNLRLHNKKQRDGGKVDLTCRSR
ncbi:hypothetical protein QFC21_005925 [Naganishia friedmannii]|uniref:Uncharacterized protein n=1 Tax=Naganishia friedmannii TaxID=89922 RepID=A0ACC2V605_9TREE|nr:hypothetical protein QFC21_005925 [Naganishia friedmannii]